MKAKLFALALLAAAALPLTVHAASAVGANVGGSAVKTGACATGYTRVAPNFCTRDSGLGNSSLTINTCSAVALPSPNAKALLIWTALVVSSSNAVGQRDTKLSGYDNATCIAPKLTEVALQTYEFSAVLSTTIAVHEGYFILQTPSGNPTLQYTSSAGNSGQVLYQVRGYWEK